MSDLIEQMRINRERLRQEIQRNQQEQIRATMKWENRKFVVSAIVAAAALAGGGATIGNYLGVHSHETMFPPGTIITIPAPAKP